MLPWMGTTPAAAPAGNLPFGITSCRPAPHRPAPSLAFGTTAELASRPSPLGLLHMLFPLPELLSSPLI